MFGRLMSGICSPSADSSYDQARSYAVNDRVYNPRSVVGGLAEAALTAPISCRDSLSLSKIEGEKID